MRKIILTLLFCLAASSNAMAATKYVLINGGPGGTTSTTCNGTANVAFTGSNGPNCAFNHPNWAIPGTNTTSYPDNPTTFAMASGDTLIVGPGDYRFGCQGTSGNTSCLDLSKNFTVNFTTDAYVAGEHIPPNGTAGAHTVIIGCSATGCGTGPKPVFWMAGSMNTLFLLTGRSYVDFQDIEITDHSVDQYGGCRTRQDVAGYPFNSLCGKVAFRALGGWHHLTFKGVDVHGVGERAFFMSGSGPSGTPVETLIEDSVIEGSAAPNWEMDGCNNDGSCGITGNITFRRTKMRWAGCAEAYPVVRGPGNTGRLPVANGCRNSNNGGYGDNLGTSDTGGNWLFEDFTCSHATEDCIDLLYLGKTSHGFNYGAPTITVIRSEFEGSVGAALKGPVTKIEDSVVIGNCAWWAGTVGQGYVAPGGFLVCRAGGTPLSIVNQTTTAVQLYNNTFLTNGDQMILAGSDRQANGNNGVCNFDTKNNILIGGYGWQQDTVAMFDAYDALGNVSCLGGLNRGMDYNICYLPFKAGYGSCDGVHDQNNVNPLFTGTLEQGTGEYQSTGFYNGIEYATHLTLQSGSPARDAATETVGDGVDINTFSRGASWDIGAYEYGSVPSGGPAPFCGDGIINGSEVCDCGGNACIDAELNHETCVSQGFSGGGTLACANTCLTYDTSACNSPTCGDGNVDAGEGCDDHNTTNGDGCSSICQIETPPTTALGTSIPGCSLTGTAIQ